MCSLSGSKITAATWGQVHFENALIYHRACLFPSHNLLWLDTMLMCATSTSLEWCGRNMNIAGLHSICCGANAFHCLWELVPSLLMHPHPSTKPLSIVCDRLECIPLGRRMYHANCSFVAGSSGLWRRRMRLNCPKRSNRVIRLRATVEDGKGAPSLSAALSLFTLIWFHYSTRAFLGGNLFLSPANCDKSRAV